MRVLLSFHINSLSLEPSLRISLKRRKTILWIRSRKYQAVIFLPKICFHLSLSQQSRNGAGRKELFCSPIPAQTDSLKFMAQHPKSLSDLEPLGNAGVFHRQFCFLGNSKGVPCQALHRAGDGPPSSRACHPRLCVPEALVHFPLVVLNPIFLFTEC